MSDRAFEIAGASYLSVESDCMIEQMIMLHGLTKWKLPSDPFLLLTFRVRARIVDMIDRRPYCSSYRGTGGHTSGLVLNVTATGERIRSLPDFNCVQTRDWYDPALRAPCYSTVRMRTLC
jgi:hypothetical protein